MSKMIDFREYGLVKVIRKVLACRASQIENPGSRECEGCPYVDEDGSCKDLEIMLDALTVIDNLDLYNKKISEVLERGYTVELSRIGTGSNKKEDSNNV